MKLVLSLLYCKELNIFKLTVNGNESTKTENMLDNSILSREIIGFHKVINKAKENPGIDIVFLNRGI